MKDIFSNIYVWITAGMYVLNIITIIALIFFERKNPEKVIKWAGVLLFVPIVGFIFYMAFGKGPSFGRRKKVLNKNQLDSKYRRKLDGQTEHIDNIYHGNDAKIAKMIKYNIAENSAICTDNNKVELYTNMYEHFADLFDSIREAKRYVNVLYFIIKPDKYGLELIDILTEKAKQGVKVRLVYDDVGCILLHGRYLNKLIEAGASVNKFFPMKLKGIGSNVNYRNHRKIVVIDGEIGYIGGCNIGKEYVSEDKKLTPWRDTHLKVKGSAVSLLDVRFIQDYNFASMDNVETIYKPCKNKVGDTAMQIISSGPDSPEFGIESAYIRAIYNAEKSIILQTPYLILDEPFKLALISAVRSGVNVKIMIPGTPDKQFVYYSTLAYAEELYQYGVEIYIYNGFLHSKTLCIDGKISSVGTFNLDIRSFKLHFEVTAMIYGETFGEQMHDVFNNDIEQCQKITDEFIQQRSLKQRFMERLAILFSPLL